MIWQILMKILGESQMKSYRMELSDFIEMPKGGNDDD